MPSNKMFTWELTTKNDGKNLHALVEIEDWRDDLFVVRVNGESIYLDPDDAREMSRALAAAAEVMDRMHGVDDED